MRDSLFSRFRSGLLGAVLGEVFLAQQSLVAPVRLSAALTNSLDQPRSAPATGRMLSQMQRWLQTELKQGTTLFPDGSIELPARQTELALVLAPVALFYHDQPLPLQAMLHQWTRRAQLADSTAQTIGVIGQIISLILRDQMTPAKLIPQLMRDLDWLSDSELISQLEQVQIWLEQSISLAAVAQEIRQRAAQPKTESEPALTGLLALYSFLSTPHQFQLTLARLARLPGCQPSDAALAGLWLGLHNGLTGLPLGWRQQLEGLSTESSLPSERELFELADQLLAVWSGAAHPQQWFQLPQHTNLIASPRVIR